MEKRYSSSTPEVLKSIDQALDAQLTDTEIDRIIDSEVPRANPYTAIPDEWQDAESGFYRE